MGGGKKGKGREREGEKGGGGGYTVKEAVKWGQE
jgi:hypothetical protein